LVIVPTVVRARLFAASLKRHGFTVAVLPDEWGSAAGGVDVAIGSRTAVFARVPELRSIVVIDEHDELHHEERAPTWNAVEVAQERARRVGIPCVLTSAVPSAQSLYQHHETTTVVSFDHMWPKIEVVNLDDVPVSGSLLSTEYAHERHDGKYDHCLCVEYQRQSSPHRV